MYGEYNGIRIFKVNLSEPDRLKSRSFRFRSLTSRKGPELGRKLLLNTNRNSYMGRPATPSDLIFKRESQGHL